MHLPENTLRHSFNYNINKKVDIMLSFERGGVNMVVNHSNVLEGEKIFVAKKWEFQLLK